MGSFSTRLSVSGFDHGSYNILGIERAMVYGPNSSKGDVVLREIRGSGLAVDDRERKKPQNPESPIWLNCGICQKIVWI